LAVEVWNEKEFDFVEHAPRPNLVEDVSAPLSREERAEKR
jgi:hypothetical protein